MALFIQERATGRKELVMRILDPPFQAMPAPAQGVLVEDASGAAGGTGGEGKAGATPGGGAKRKRAAAGP